MGFKLRLIVDGEVGPCCEEGGEVRIGRASFNELHLDRSGVSRRHARIFGVGGRFLVEDLGSSNGTALNGRLLRAPLPLQHRDRIRIGETELEVEVGGAGPATSLGRIRPGRLLVVAASLVLLVVGAHWLAGSAAQAESRGAAVNQDVDLAEVDEGEVFGAGHDAASPVLDRLVFSFQVEAGAFDESRLSLRYAARSVPENSLEIQLNDRTIGFAAAAPASWQEGSEVLLPRELLQVGQSNRVAFVVSYGAAEDWLIRTPELVIEPIPSCAPVACVEQAERLHAIGVRRFEARALVSSNLYEAWSAFREAGLFLAPLQGRTPLHDRIDELSALTKGALDQRCSQLRFTVMRSVALGDEPAARRAANEILRSFPEDGHRCRQAGRYLLDLLDG